MVVHVQLPYFYGALAVRPEGAKPYGLVTLQVREAQVRKWGDWAMSAR